MFSCLPAAAAVSLLLFFSSSFPSRRCLFSGLFFFQSTQERARERTTAQKSRQQKVSRAATVVESKEVHREWRRTRLSFFDGFLVMQLQSNQTCIQTSPCLCVLLLPFLVLAFAPAKSLWHRCIGFAGLEQEGSMCVYICPCLCVCANKKKDWKKVCALSQYVCSNEQSWAASLCPNWRRWMGYSSLALAHEREHRANAQDTRLAHMDLMIGPSFGGDKKKRGRGKVCVCLLLLSFWSAYCSFSCSLSFCSSLLL